MIKPQTTQQKPLFIPLKSEYYNAFLDGSKTEELRRYGPMWNERTCAIGRPVTLSRGYGKKNRTKGKVSSFKHQLGSTFGRTYKKAIEDCYGTLNIEIACIGIEVDHG